MKNVDRALALAAQIMEIEAKAKELHQMSMELRAELEAMLASKAEHRIPSVPLPEIPPPKKLGGRPPRPDKEVDARVMAVLKEGPEYSTHLATKAKVASRTAKASLARLAGRKKVRQLDDGSWALT